MEITTITTTNERIQYNYNPDICPICQHAVSPTLLAASSNGLQITGNSIVNIAFQCTHRECMHMFIGIYQWKTNNTFELIKTEPIKYKAPSIFLEVSELSPSFTIIYNQSCAAESYNLTEIAGVGYRKALEFLIKDYSTYKKPNKEEEIKKTFLGKVIKEYIDDTNIKVCAERATWLGNDETHYVRKWENKDIKDLKLLIELTTGWVRNNLLTEKYLTEMS